MKHESGEIPHRCGCEPRAADLMDGFLPFYIVGFTMLAITLGLFAVEESTGRSMTWPGLVILAAVLVIGAIWTRKGGVR